LAHFKDLQSTTPKATHPCIRKGCGKAADNSLTINYLNKIGWFCNDCKNELIEEGLVIENKSGLGNQPNPATAPVPEQAISEAIENQEYFLTRTK
jgi:hypothetical protein